MLELALVVIVVILTFCAWLLWLCAKLLEQLRELSAWDLKRKLGEKRGRESFLDGKGARAIEAVACRDVLAMPAVD